LKPFSNNGRRGIDTKKSRNKQRVIGSFTISLWRGLGERMDKRTEPENFGEKGSPIRRGGKVAKKRE